MNKIKLISKKKFSELSIKEKRVEIAKDVLKRIKSKLILPQTGFLFTTMPIKSHMNSKTVQKLLNEQKCKVYAKGALICSWIGNFNNYNGSKLCGFSETINYTTDFPQELVKIFGLPLLSAIETIFEGHVLSWNKSDEKLSEQQMQYLTYATRDNQNDLIYNGEYH